MKLIRPQLLLFSIGFFILASSCSFFQNCEVGEGETTEVILDIEDFSKLDISSNVKVFLEQSTEQKVLIKAQNNLIALLNTEVKGEEWDIKFNRCVKSETPIEIHIQTKGLDEVSINGSGSVENTSILTNSELELSINGSGSIDMFLSVKELSSSISGSGDIRLKGNAKSHEIEIDGSGDVMAIDFVSDETDVEINGSGDVRVNTSYNLDVEINGSGDVYYKGNPKQISSDINGSGNLHQEK